MIGVGIDSVEIERFRALLDRQPGFIDRVFSPQERLDLGDRKDPVPGFAARFAAKEATMKALGVGIGSFKLAEVEVVRSESGVPSLRTSGAATALAVSLGVGAFHVSLTHTESMASAIVVAE